MARYYYAFSNNASTTLAAPITAAATSLSVAAGAGSLFPIANAGTGDQVFIATLVSASNPTTREIILVLNRSGDTFTAIQRAQEGTTALAWNAGDIVANLPTAGGLAHMSQTYQTQGQANNYAVDTGSANAYSVNFQYSPLNAHAVGMPIRFLAATGNTSSTVTFNDGAGVAPMQTGGGIQPGNIVAGNIYEVVWTGAFFMLMNPSPLAFAQIAGTLLNAQVPAGAVTQYASTLFAGAVLTGIPTTPTPAVGAQTQQVVNAAFVNPAFFNGNPGYVTLPSGIVIKWGYIQSPAGTPTPWLAHITFSPAFPAACYMGIGCTNASTARASGSGFVSGVSNTGMSVLFDALDNENNNINGGYWLAIGH
jgi:hypothetical protein